MKKYLLILYEFSRLLTKKGRMVTDRTTKVDKER